MTKMLANTNEYIIWRFHMTIKKQLFTYENMICIWKTKNIVLLFSMET